MRAEKPCRSGRGFLFSIAVEKRRITENDDGGGEAGWRQGQR